MDTCVSPAGFPLACMQLIDSNLQVSPQGFKLFLTVLKQLQAFLHCFFLRLKPTIGHAAGHKRLKFFWN